MIAVVTSLYVLLLLDGSFSGICAASGRNAVLNKRSYYARSMWDGMLWANVACLLGVLLLSLTVAFSADRQTTLDAMVAVGRRMSCVYWLYAAVVFASFLVRAMPSVDIRAITSTVSFGPLTFIRPIVVLAGVLWGLRVRPAPDKGVMIAAAIIALMMMCFRVFLDHRFGKMPRYAHAFRQSTSR